MAGIQPQSVFSLEDRSKDYVRSLHGPSRVSKLGTAVAGFFSKGVSSVYNGGKVVVCAPFNWGKAYAVGKIADGGLNYAKEQVDKLIKDAATRSLLRKFDLVQSIRRQILKDHPNNEALQASARRLQELMRRNPSFAEQGLLQALFTHPNAALGGQAAAPFNTLKQACIAKDGQRISAALRDLRQAVAGQKPYTHYISELEQLLSRHNGAVALWSEATGKEARRAVSDERFLTLLKWQAALAEGKLEKILPLLKACPPALRTRSERIYKLVSEQKVEQAKAKVATFILAENERVYLALLKGAQQQRMSMLREVVAALLKGNEGHFYEVLETLLDCEPVDFGRVCQELESLRSAGRLGAEDLERCLEVSPEAIARQALESMDLKGVHAELRGLLYGKMDKVDMQTMELERALLLKEGDKIRVDTELVKSINSAIGEVRRGKPYPGVSPAIDAKWEERMVALSWAHLNSLDLDPIVRKDLEEYLKQNRSFFTYQALQELQIQKEVALGVMEFQGAVQATTTVLLQEEFNRAQGKGFINCAHELESVLKETHSRTAQRVLEIVRQFADGDIKGLDRLPDILWGGLSDQAQNGLSALMSAQKARECSSLFERIVKDMNAKAHEVFNQDDQQRFKVVQQFIEAEHLGAAVEVLEDIHKAAKERLIQAKLESDVEAQGLEEERIEYLEKLLGALKKGIAKHTPLAQCLLSVFNADGHKARQLAFTQSKDLVLRQALKEDVLKLFEDEEFAVERIPESLRPLIDTLVHKIETQKFVSNEDISKRIFTEARDYFRQQDPGLKLVRSWLTEQSDVLQLSGKKLLKAMDEYPFTKRETLQRAQKIEERLEGYLKLLTAFTEGAKCNEILVVVSELDYDLKALQALIKPLEGDVEPPAEFEKALQQVSLLLKNLRAVRSTHNLLAKPPTSIELATVEIFHTAVCGGDFAGSIRNFQHEVQRSSEQFLLANILEQLEEGGVEGVWQHLFGSEADEESKNRLKILGQITDYLGSPKGRESIKSFIATRLLHVVAGNSTYKGQALGVAPLRYFLDAPDRDFKAICDGMVDNMVEVGRSFLFSKPSEKEDKNAPSTLLLNKLFRYAADGGLSQAADKAVAGSLLEYLATEHEDGKSGVDVFAEKLVDWFKPKSDVEVESESSFQVLGSNTAALKAMMQRPESLQPIACALVKVLSQRVDPQFEGLKAEDLRQELRETRAALKKQGLDLQQQFNPKPLTGYIKNTLKQQLTRTRIQRIGKPAVCVDFSKALYGDWDSKHPITLFRLSLSKDHALDIEIDERLFDDLIEVAWNTAWLSLFEQLDGLVARRDDPKLSESPDSAIDAMPLVSEAIGSVSTILTQACSETGLRKPGMDPDAELADLGDMLMGFGYDKLPLPPVMQTFLKAMLTPNALARGMGGMIGFQSLGRLGMNNFLDGQYMFTTILDSLSTEAVLESMKRRTRGRRNLYDDLTDTALLTAGGWAGRKIWGGAPPPERPHCEEPVRQAVGRMSMALISVLGNSAEARNLKLLAERCKETFPEQWDTLITDLLMDLLREQVNAVLEAEPGTPLSLQKMKRFLGKKTCDSLSGQRTLAQSALQQERGEPSKASQGAEPNRSPEEIRKEMYEHLMRYIEPATEHSSLKGLAWGWVKHDLYRITIKPISRLAKFIFKSCYSHGKTGSAWKEAWKKSLPKRLFWTKSGRVRRVNEAREWVKNIRREIFENKPLMANVYKDVLRGLILDPVQETERLEKSRKRLIRVCHKTTKRVHELCTQAYGFLPQAYRDQKAYERTIEEAKRLRDYLEKLKRDELNWWKRRTDPKRSDQLSSEAYRLKYQRWCDDLDQAFERAEQSINQLIAQTEHQAQLVGF